MKSLNKMVGIRNGVLCVGIKVVVDADSLMYILGTTIDYKEDDIAAEFVFDNPLVDEVDSCEA